MAEAFVALAFFGFFLAVTAAIVLVIIGRHVVKKFPDRLDPERNAKRYTRPAGVLVLIVVISVIVLIVGLIGAGVTLLIT